MLHVMSFCLFVCCISDIVAKAQCIKNIVLLDIVLYVMCIIFPYIVVILM